jgi:hypothetical protein
MADKGVKPKCKLCEEIFVTGGKAIKCEGICGQYFHWACLKEMENKLDFDFYTKSSNLRFFCKSCYSEGTYISHILANLRFMKKQQETQNEQVSKLIAIITKQSEEITVLKSQISEVSVNMKPVPTWPAPHEVTNKKNVNNMGPSISTKVAAQVPDTHPTAGGKVSQPASISSTTSSLANKAQKSVTRQAQSQTASSMRQEPKDAVAGVTVPRRGKNGPVLPGCSTTLSPEDPEPQHDDVDGSTWTRQGPRSRHMRRRPPNFGSANVSDCPLIAVKRKAHLHVWRLDINTTVESISEYLLKQHKIVSEVVKLNAKGPYASFRVSSDFANLDLLQDPNIWPINAAIGRFNFNFSKNFPNQKSQQ